MRLPSGHQRTWAMMTYKQPSRQLWRGGGSKDLAQFFFSCLPNEDMEKYIT
jgi:hypothetical protein